MEQVAWGQGREAAEIQGPRSSHSRARSAAPAPSRRSAHWVLPVPRGSLSLTGGSWNSRDWGPKVRPEVGTGA